MSLHQTRLGRVIGSFLSKGGQILCGRCFLAVLLGGVRPLVDMMPVSRRTRCRPAQHPDRGRYAAIWRLPKKGYFVNIPSISCINSIVARSTSTGVEQIEDRLILSSLHWRVRLRSIFSLPIIPRRSPSHRYFLSTAGQWTGSSL